MATLRQAFGKLLPAEAMIATQVGNGVNVELGDKLPDRSDESRKVRAKVLRHIILAKDPGAAPHEKGVRVLGAWITGALDLEGCRIPRDVVLIGCRFDAAPVLRSASIDNLILNHSALPGLNADGLVARGTMILRETKVCGEIQLRGAKLGGSLICDGAMFERPDDCALSADGLEVQGSVLLRRVTVRGGARLLGAKIGGNLECTGATFERSGDCALDADGVQVRGFVFLRDAKVLGVVRLVGAKLGGDLSCNCATFEWTEGGALIADGLEARGSVFLRKVTVRGKARLLGAKLGGDLDCGGARFVQPGEGALSANYAEIGGAFILRNGAHIEGCLDLSGARIGHITDDRACWPGPGNLILYRCRYGAFMGGPVDAKARLDWLALQKPAQLKQDFWPQPYEQLAKVLREMGHGADARIVLIEKERLQRRARLADLTPFQRQLARFKDFFLDHSIRFGYRPRRAFGWLLVPFAIGFAFFWAASAFDAVKPNNAFVLRSPEWVLCGKEIGQRLYLASRKRIASGRADHGEAQRACYLRQPEAGSYPTFTPWIYSIDTLLPVVNLEMQEYWIPDENTWLGAGARWYLWLHIALGWGLSLLAVAAFSGLVRSD